MPKKNAYEQVIDEAIKYSKGLKEPKLREIAIKYPLNAFYLYKGEEVFCVSHAFVEDIPYMIFVYRKDMGKRSNTDNKIEKAPISDVEIHEDRLQYCKDIKEATKK